MDRRHRANPGLVYLDPVWLFSNHVGELLQLLSELGETRIVTARTCVDDIAQIDQLGPIGWLRLLVPVADVSVTLYPTHVAVAWADEWHPTQTERDVVSEVIRFLEGRRHPLYYLLKTEWQVIAAAATLALLMLAAGLCVRGRPNLPLASFGVFWGVLVLAWIILGRFVPSRTHLALFPVGEQEFAERSTRRLLAIVAAIVLLVVGFLIGLFVGWTTYFWPP
jgi:hypothetical protein